MKALVRFEQLMQRTLEDGFTRLLRPQLQPVAIAKRLARAMEDGQTVGAGRNYVPNSYVVRLSLADFASFQPYLATLQRELAEYLLQVAAERDFALPGRPHVELRADATLAAHSLAVQARLVDASPPAEADRAALSGATTKLTLNLSPAAPSLPRGWLALGQGESEVRFALEQLPITIGRALDNAVVLEDQRVSRHHAQIRSQPPGYCVIDLGSTNGTFVNGERVVQPRRLKSGDVISVGGAELRLVLEGAS